MYVKLVTPSTASASQYFIRDIVRLLTAATPSTSLLYAFNSATSVVMDATPAGWTYVGSTLAADRPTPSTSVSDYAQSTSGPDLWAVSAPCLEGSTLKYATLSSASQGFVTPTTTNQWFNLTAARSVTSLGVATNEGVRVYSNSTTVFTFVQYTAIQFSASTVYHLIATPRGICLINEGRGMHAVWETSMTDPHRFYSTAPVVVWQNGNFNNTYSAKVTPLTSVIPQANAIAQTNAQFSSCVMNITDVNTGTVYGPVEPCQNGLGGAYSNSQNWWLSDPADMRKNSIDATGMPKYQVAPIYVQPGQFGYPNMYVTGVFNAYWTAPALGNTGDTVTVNGNYYTYFNCGTAMWGILMQTS